MRNYWFRILLGAVCIFAVGMIGVSLVRGGIAKVNSVVEGSGPITIPLGLIPFVLAGERLGNLDRVTLHRDSPSRVSGVELEVKLSDSLLAPGLSGCRLAANFEGDSTDRGVNIRVKRDHNNAFQCVPKDSTPPDLVDFGVAIFHPGDVEVPLLLPADVVTELQSLDFTHDSSRSDGNDATRGITVPDADSIATSARRFADSIRAEARKRLAESADSR